MQLNGKQIAECQEALLAAYPSQELLRQMVRIELDQNLDAIAGGSNLRAIVFNLLQWATMQGLAAELLHGAQHANPGNPQLRELCQRYGIVGPTAALDGKKPDAKSTGASETPLPARPAVPLDSGGVVAQPPFVRPLLDAVMEDALVPFVGAGLSMGAGLPGWYDLIAELARQSAQPMPPREWASGDLLISIAQNYVNQQGLHALVMYLKDRLDTTGREPTAAHRALARLPASMVFTANYDDLLERAFRAQGKRVQVVVRDGDIPFMRKGAGSVNIIKLYGDLTQPDTLVLTSEQYERFFLERPQLVKLLEVELGRSTLLYLGWSHTDPHFKLLFGETIVQYGRHMRGGFAAMFNIDTMQRRELERRQIRVVELPPGANPTERLATWLTGIGASGAA